MFWRISEAFGCVLVERSGYLGFISKDKAVKYALEMASECGRSSVLVQSENGLPMKVVKVHGQK